MGCIRVIDKIITGSRIRGLARCRIPYPGPQGREVFINLKDSHVINFKKMNWNAVLGFVFSSCKKLPVGSSVSDVFGPPGSVFISSGGQIDNANR